ncbi:MAG: hypothetical protein AAF487_03070 [Bacteroidota bacterium]
MKNLAIIAIVLMAAACGGDSGISAEDQAAQNEAIEQINTIETQAAELEKEIEAVGKEVEDINKELDQMLKDI